MLRENNVPVIHYADGEGQRRRLGKAVQKSCSQVAFWKLIDVLHGDQNRKGSPGIGWRRTVKQHGIFRACTQFGTAGAKEGALRDQTAQAQVQTGSGLGLNVLLGGLALSWDTEKVGVARSWGFLPSSLNLSR